MSYSTGEIAALCQVTVRTVQFYDKEGLLKPETRSEGGRRLYGEDGLKTLQMICLYKRLGLNLAQIKSVLSDEENCRKILLRVLEEREKMLTEEIKQKLSCRESVKTVRREIAEGGAFSPKSFSDIRTIMKGKQKQRGTYALMLVVGFLADAAIVTTAVLWGVMGLWLPFAIAMPCALAAIAGAVAIAYKNLAYVCTDCGKKFRPSFREFFFSAHTPKTRRCTCTHCGSKNFHAETYSD